MVLEDLKRYNHTLIGSKDYWGADDATYDENTNWYAKAFIVSESEVAEKPELITELGLSPCALYYEIGRTDAHGFTPTQIVYDPDANAVMIEGTQQRLGEEGEDFARPRIYIIGSDAPQYMSMSKWKSMKGGRFEVDGLVVSDDEEKTEAKEYFDLLQGEKDEEEEVAELESEYLSGAYGPGGLADEAVLGAYVNDGRVLGQGYVGDVLGQEAETVETLAAETLERINPIAVEGAEDILGAESVLGDEAVLGEYVNDGRVIGQGYVGDVIGQDAETQGYDDRDDESIGERNRSKHKQSLKDRRDESKGMEKALGNRAYSDVSTMDHDAEYLSGAYAPDGLADEAVLGAYVNDGRVLGQGYVGDVIGQEAEEVASGEWGSMNPDESNHDFMWNWRNAEEGQNDIMTVNYDAETNLLQVGTRHGESFTVNAENGAILSRAEEFEAEPAELLSAEDVDFLLSGASLSYNAESVLGDEAVLGEYVNDGRVIGQGYVGDVIGQDAETQGYDDRDDESIGARNRGKHKQSLKDRRDESKAMTAKGDPHHPYSDVGTMDAEFFPDGDGRNFGNITADMQMEPLGFNAQGYDDKDDESIGERNRGKHKQSLKDRRDESKGMERDLGNRVYSDVGTMDAETISPDVLDRAAQNMRDTLEDSDGNVVDFVRDAPIISDMRLSGWTASALVLGIAWWTGRNAKRYAKESEFHPTELGVVGEGSDFGQDEAVIWQHPQHFIPQSFNLVKLDNIGDSPLDYKPF